MRSPSLLSVDDTLAVPLRTRSQLWSARLAAVGGCLLSLLGATVGRQRIAVAFGFWVTRARAHRQVRWRWRELVRAAEMNPFVCHAGAGPGWRLKLRQRSQGMRTHYRRGFWRCKQPLYDRLRIARGIFIAWRMWAQNNALAEEFSASEARNASLHASAGPWWLQMQ